MRGEHANLLNYIKLYYYHMIITLDIHYVYCIYVLIIVVSYIAIDDDDDNDRLLSVIEERESENRTCTHIHAYHSGSI